MPSSAWSFCFQFFDADGNQISPLPDVEAYSFETFLYRAQAEFDFEIVLLQSMFGNMNMFANTKDPEKIAKMLAELGSASIDNEYEIKCVRLSPFV